MMRSFGTLTNKSSLLVVYFLVLFSIVVHGLSIPILSAIYKYQEVRPITEDAVELRRRSIYVPTPVNAFKGDSDTFIAYNRFFRPLVNIATLPLVRPKRHHSNDNDSVSTESEEEIKRRQLLDIHRVEST